jgi:hypothetical protein
MFWTPAFAGVTALGTFYEAANAEKVNQYKNVGFFPGVFI